MMTYDKQFTICAEECNYLAPELIPSMNEHFQNPLRLMHLNICSLKANYDELLNLIAIYEDNRFPIHVILLCETSLSDSNAFLYQIPGFDSVHSNRQSKQRGGVAIFVRNQLDFTLRKDLGIFHEGKFESIFVELRLPNYTTPLIIGEIYRVPGLNVSETLDSYEMITSRLHDSNSRVIFGTDQNLDLAKLRYDSLTRTLYQHLEIEGFLPTVDVPTRVDGESATIIDNLYVRGVTSKSKSNVIETNISDHFPLVLTIDLSMNPNKNTPVIMSRRVMNEVSVQQISADLRAGNWQPLEQLPCDSAYEYFLAEINSALDRYAPVKKIKIPAKSVRREPWFSKGIQKSSRQMSKLYAKAVKTNKDSPCYAAYIRYRNMYNSIKRAAKKMYYDDLFNEHRNDISATWKILNGLTKRNKHNDNRIDKLKIDGVEISDPQMVTDAFADFFANVGPKQAELIATQMHSVGTTPPPLPSFSVDEQNANTIFLHPVVEEEIVRIISGLKSKKSTGIDNISTNFVKQLKTSLSAPLSVLMNRSFAEGCFPNALKKAKTIPIFKKK